MKVKNIIIGVTGSVACYKACEVISRLKRLGHNITVVMTKEAAEFITPLTFQGLSENQVYVDMFKPVEHWQPKHISLAEKADLVLIAPATANIIAKLANGICDDLLSCVVISTKAKILIAPAMNKNMYSHNATQENIRKLESFGYKFIGPIKGHLICGDVGIGHIADTDEIVKETKKLLRAN